MLDLGIVKSLKKRYANVHPLIFQRSIERARSEVELFDILESLPEDLPIMWDEDSHCWVPTRDVFLTSSFHFEGSEE